MKTHRSPKRLPFGGWLLLLVLVLPAARAQNYVIDQSTVHAGGTSTGGVFCVSGTVGQPDASKLSGGDFTLDGGFWGIVAAVQTPGAPLLSIILNPQLSTISVSWPSPSTGWVLQQNTNGVASGDWRNATEGVQDDGTTRSLVVNPIVGNRFYRLFKP